MKASSIIAGFNAAALEYLQGNKVVTLLRTHNRKARMIVGMALLFVLLPALLWLVPAMGQTADVPVDCEEFAFSTEEDFVTQGPEPPDGNPIISDGDLLGMNCVICARNRDLTSAFDVSQSLDLGLDAADVIDAETSRVAFSTELDSPNVGQFTAGDLLIVHEAAVAPAIGTVIPNAVLLEPFGVGHDAGLDAVHFVGEKDSIIAFLDAIDGRTRDDWQTAGELAGLLEEYGIDIWFSIEGTAPTPEAPAFLDGDLLSAATGTIVAPNADLLPAGVPAGIVDRGVDFGLDGAASNRSTEVQAILFSTEILYQGEPAFTDGDVLQYGTAAIVYTNPDLIACFEPRARFLGLDALHIAPPPPPDQWQFLPLILRQWLQM
jgi:hypothetical protein